MAATRSSGTRMGIVAGLEVRSIKPRFSLGLVAG
jgi:hypothetical protein